MCHLGRPKGCAAAPDSLQTCCCGHHLCRQTLFLGVQVCRLGRPKGCVAALDSLQTRCCGSLVPAAAPDNLQTCCCGHHLCRQTLFLGVQVCHLGRQKAAQRLQTACKRAAVATTCAGRLFSWGFKCAVWGRPKRCVAALDSLQTCCCGHHLCRQTVFLGVQLCRLAGLREPGTK